MNEQQDLTGLKKLAKLGLILMTEDYSEFPGIVDIKIFKYSEENLDKAVAEFKAAEHDPDEGKWAQVGTSIEFPNCMQSALDQDHEDGIQITVWDQDEKVFSKIYHDYEEFKADYKAAREL